MSELLKQAIKQLKTLDVEKQNAIASMILAINCYCKYSLRKKESIKCDRSYQQKFSINYHTIRQQTNN